ncbi:MAG TPA: hypothetical protein P5244_06545, partial [Syntrophales bacterium]|nr:hypothetical protein [Syntrophales bacterium]
MNVTTTGVASGAAFGAAYISVAAQIVTATAIDTDEAHGAAQLNLALPLTGLASNAALGTLLTQLFVVASG